MNDIRAALSNAIANARTPMNTTQTPIMNAQAQAQDDIRNQNLRAALSAWDDDSSLSTNAPAQTQQTQSTAVGEKSPQAVNYFQDKGVSRAVFNRVYMSPGIQFQDAVKSLTMDGINPTSSTSLLSQMVKQKLVERDEDSRLFAIVSEYTPLKSKSSFNNQMAKKAAQAKLPKRKYTKRVNVAAPAPQVQAPVPVAAPAPARAALVIQRDNKPLTAAAVLETLNVKEAYDLYKELCKMFE